MAAVPLPILPHVLEPSAVPVAANGNLRPPAAAPRAARPRTSIAVVAEERECPSFVRPTLEIREIAAAWLVFLALAAAGTALSL